MEYLDTYDENKNYLGKQSRDIVHRDGLWHNTVHCWLYDKKGNIYFQIRKDENTFYTTASGHISAGETVKEGFGREIKEEIGIEVDYNSATLVDIIPFIMDKVKGDGSIFRDRAFSNVYVCEFDGDIEKFHFDHNEINGLVKINAKEALKLFNKEADLIKGEIITQEADKKKVIEKSIGMNDFLINKGETAIKKYGFILEKVINLTFK